VRLKNLQEIPKFADKLSYLYVEHAVVDRHEKAIALHQADGTTPVPSAALGVLVLGPGTTITHAAVQTLADNNCLVIWSGEQGVRFYAQGLGGSRHSRNMIHQARLVSNDLTRLQVVVRMYCLRFREPVDMNLTLQQLRGMEGIRVRQSYADAAREAGVTWQGRSYNREKWDYSDPVNRALSAANSCLYGLVHAAILSAGYSPALGFIHTGKQLSFVYDIADLYKADLTIPMAFKLAAANPPNLEREVRIACRDRFKESRLMEKIIPDIAKVLDVDIKALEAQPDEFADDAALPAEWWTPQSIPASVPIGKILKLCPNPDPIAKEEKDHDHPDSGTSPGVTAG